MFKTTTAAICVVAASTAAFFSPVFSRLHKVLQTPVSADRKTNDALRIGLLGASTIAKFALVYPAGKRRDVVIVAVAARNAEKTNAYAQRYGIPAAFSGPDAFYQLLNQSDVQAVYISLPTQLHVYWAKAALAAGKHVLLEKPAALNSAEAADILRTVEDTGLVLWEAAHWRFHPAAHFAYDQTNSNPGISPHGRVEHPSAISPLKSVVAKFQIIDPLTLWPSPVASLSAAAREHERVKNFDRWWYCVDEILWFTNAKSWKVRSATEGRYRIEASIDLDVVGVQGPVSATMRMTRDALWPLLDWSVHVESDDGKVSYKNVGFPSIWHGVVSENITDRSARSETVYGHGGTTFEYQLAAFVQEVQGHQKNEVSRINATASIRRASLTLSLVEDILRAAGSDLLGHIMID